MRSPLRACGTDRDSGFCKLLNGNTRTQKSLSAFFFLVAWFVCPVCLTSFPHTRAIAGDDDDFDDGKCKQKRELIALS